jgi:hypothetical protein
MVVIQQEETRGRVSHSDRRKRAAAKKRMKSGKKGGWQTLSKDDREFLAAVFKEYDVNGTGTMVRAREPTPLGEIARFAEARHWLTSPPPFVLSLPPGATSTRARRRSPRFFRSWPGARCRQRRR